MNEKMNILSFLFIVQLFLILIKLIGLVDCAWIIIFIPLYVYCFLALLAFIIILIILHITNCSNLIPIKTYLDSKYNNLHDELYQIKCEVIQIKKEIEIVKKSLQ